MEINESCQAGGTEQTMYDISRIAVLSTIERMCREDRTFLMKMRLNGKVLRSDVRKMDDEQLVAKLASLGLDCRREVIAPLVANMKSAADLEDELIRHSGVMLSDLDDDFAWLALIVLWERWFPDVANAEMLDESMQRGYELNDYSDAGLAAAVEEWAHTWKMVKDLSRRFSAASVEAFDQIFNVTQFVFNWSSDFEMELGNAEVFGLPCIGREHYMEDFDRTFPLSAGHLLPIDGPFDDDDLDYAPNSSLPAATEPKKIKVGRNESCPCGSGKKFKKCCGR